MHLIVYLHGFKSSPNSYKARLTHQAVQALQNNGHELDWFCPQLPPSPKAAMTMVQAEINQRTWNKLSLIGSSLGGYYATYLAEQYPSRVTLLNPAIEPARDLEAYIGKQKAWHSEEDFHFLPEYIDELKQLYIQGITQAERYLLVAAKGDEVLDWREMVNKYPKAHHWILEGSDHAISEYADYIDQVMAFHLETSLTQRNPT